jgi:hypothetical protein
VTGARLADAQGGPTIAAALDKVGPRLRGVREQRGFALTVAAEHAGMSKSTKIVIPVSQSTSAPRAHGSTSQGAAEVLSIFGQPGERMLVRAPAGDRETHPDPHQDRP